MATKKELQEKAEAAGLAFGPKTTKAELEEALGGLPSPATPPEARAPDPTKKGFTKVFVLAGSHGEPKGEHLERLVASFEAAALQVGVRVGKPKVSVEQKGDSTRITLEASAERS